MKKQPVPLRFPVAVPKKNGVGEAREMEKAMNQHFLGGAIAR